MVEDKPQITVLPEIAPGGDGDLLIANVLAALLAQVVLAVTEIVPEVNVGEILTVRFVAVVIIGEAPIVEVTPAGSVQV